MVRKRKDITQINSKLTSRRMRSATLGSHVPRVRPAHMNADQVGFSSPRRQKRAARLREQRHAQRPGPAKPYRLCQRARVLAGVKRRTLTKRVGIAVAVVAVLAAVAYGVGSFTLMETLTASWRSRIPMPPRRSLP